MSTLLEELGIAYWLFGGPAVDFDAGSVTRAHADRDRAELFSAEPVLEGAVVS